MNLYEVLLKVAYQTLRNKLDKKATDQQTDKLNDYIIIQLVV